MLVLLDTSHQQPLNQCSEELGYDVEQLLTPLTRYNLQRPDSRFAIDNGAFSQFNEKGFVSLLKREKHRKNQCIFVSVPDVVGSAIRTLEVFSFWVIRPELHGWRLAYVCQDGQENVPIPWGNISAIFIGGSTKWKESEQAAQCVKAAKCLGKWVHVGRVNNYQRLKHFEDLGADSCDGTGISRYTHMRTAIKDTGKQQEICV